MKCTHGAAVGRLDEDALFYLRSRGAPRAARSLLTYAFARELVDRVRLEPLRARVEELLADRLLARTTLHERATRRSRPASGHPRAPALPGPFDVERVRDISRS